MLPFVEIKSNHLQLAPSQRILRSQDYLSYLSAQELVEAARAQAADIVAEARAVYEEQKSLGWQAGIDEARREQAVLIHQTQLQCQGYYRTVEQQMSEVVLQAVRKILHDYDQVALTLKVVREALSLVSNQKQVTIRVHPEQVQAVRDQIARVHKDFPEIGYLEISADARLDQGGCILETEVGIIDASLDGQLEALSLAMNSVLEKRGEQQARLAGANTAVE
ncbi:TPA: SctL family type III secretion system stator protein AscL [Aeromonas hydrophila]|uniref:SctL family type III secretion system stator protein AscL n=1 Tax=Aeromonas TaxID=642 RepID=UPI00058A1AFE|nr:MULTISPECIES: SctL family type III secretion system stator protein AscL [Aeromonas]AZU48828.1 type III secretion system protein [Aeromonas hydrophila]MCV3294935.1 SctL family type III secretion system stator protein AscL [Aeromonas hydrophila]MXV28188.1 HrpE/YscL family type III secretion apparatus protein [Aeromonas veronii]QBX70716.1 HrpE/YscL family type III secretion apparatus protein [Aeromonas hydrophila]QBX75441.1 HrpE/YscL family type III secretion apparatus protein [Aeromonas hydro